MLREALGNGLTILAPRMENAWETGDEREMSGR